MSKICWAATGGSYDHEGRKSNPSKNSCVIRLHQENFVVGDREYHSTEDRPRRRAAIVGFLYPDVALTGLINRYIRLNRHLGLMYLTNTVGLDTIVTLLKKFAAESHGPDLMPAPLLRQFVTESEGVSELKAKAT